MQIIGSPGLHVSDFQAVVECQHVEALKAKERGYALVYIGQTGEWVKSWCVQIVTANRWVDVKCVFEMMSSFQVTPVLKPKTGCLHFGMGAILFGITLKSYRRDQLEHQILK